MLAMYIDSLLPQFMNGHFVYYIPFFIVSKQWDIVNKIDLCIITGNIGHLNATQGVNAASVILYAVEEVNKLLLYFQV